VHKLRWPTRELQILTGLGIYIMITLCVVILHTHNMATMQFHWLDQLLVASYLLALGFWILASTTKVAEPE
jgi:predicted ferric reductase